MARQRKGMTENRRHRAAQALALRSKGHSYGQIADKLNVCTATAWEDVDKALKEITREPAEHVLTLELQRLDENYLRLTHELTRVTKHLEEDFDLAAVEQIRKLIASQITVSERRARLLGLDTLKHDASDALMEALHGSFTILEDTPLETLDPDGEF